MACLKIRLPSYYPHIIHILFIHDHISSNIIQILSIYSPHSIHILSTYYSYIIHIHILSTYYRHYIIYIYIYNPHIVHIFSIYSPYMIIYHQILSKYYPYIIYIYINILSISTEKFGGWDPNGVRKPPLKIWENMGN